MADGDGVDEHIFIRGNPKTPGDTVPRQFLTALSNSKNTCFKSGSGRLELAHYMTDPSNPFLARVMVNRVWLHLFGRGIVPTPDDFGRLGQPPTPAGQNLQLTLNTLGRLEDEEQFRAIVVKTADDGSATYLRDVVADDRPDQKGVELGAKNYDVNSYLDGDPAVTMAIIRGGPE